MTDKSLDVKIKEVATRIRELRSVAGLDVHEIANEVGVTVDEYLACERGEMDLNFAFLYRCAQIFGVDVTDIIEGSSPKLAGYTVVRSGEGQKIEQAHGMVYYNLASALKTE